VTGVVVVGSLNRDYVCSVDRLPTPGETRLGSELTLHSGGKGGNQAVAAALVGAVADVPCAIVGSVGDDPDGAALREDLRAAGVDTDAVVVSPGVRTGAALITVAADGENTIVVASGANHAVPGPRVSQAVDRLVGPDTVVLVQGELQVAVTEETVRRAAAAGARVVINLAPFTSLAEDVLRRGDPVVVNESEAAAMLSLRALAGAADEPGRTSGLPTGESAALALAAVARSAVLTLGAAGALVAVDGSCIRLPASAVDVVDTTGAGDAFTGALAAGLAAGHDLAAAAGWGLAVASWSVGRAGAQASYPRGADCARLLGTMPTSRRGGS
jgi:ribokinase